MMRGFTLIEMMIVVAILAIIGFVAVGFVSDSVPRNQLQAETDALVGMARRAQSRTIAGQEGDVWGVRVETTRAILFLGDDFAARDAAFDEVRLFPNGVRATGTGEVAFRIRTGTPLASATFILANVDASRSRTVAVNVQGQIYEME